MIKNVGRKVEQLLRDVPELRDSDKELLLAYWQNEGLELSDIQKRKFMMCTTAESITRARRALRDKYKGSETVEAARYTKYIEMRDEFGYPIMVLDKQ